MSVNSVIVELSLRETASVCTLKVGRMICLKGRNRRGSIGTTSFRLISLVQTGVLKLSGAY